MTAPERELREIRKALTALTNAVVDVLLCLDSVVGPDKRIPYDVSSYLGKLASQLQFANDQARHFGLNMDFPRMRRHVQQRRTALRKLSPTKEGT